MRLSSIEVQTNAATVARVSGLHTSTSNFYSADDASRVAFHLSLGSHQESPKF